MKNSIKYVLILPLLLGMLLTSGCGPHLAHKSGSEHQAKKDEKKANKSKKTKKQTKAKKQKSKSKKSKSKSKKHTHASSKHTKKQKGGTMYDDAHAHGKYKEPEEYVSKGSPEDFMITVGNRILFDFNSFQIKPEEKSILDEQIKWLKTYHEYDILLEGHCDERGTREYNIALGEKRTNAIKKYMTKNGIHSDRIRIISYGKDKPAVEGSNEEAWRLNRRVVIVINVSEKK